MSSAFPLGRDNIRLSDDERSAAMAALGKFYAEGRLTLTEYDSRCKRIAEAQLHGDIPVIFKDLPANSSYLVPFDDEPVYSASEIERAHQSSKHTRAGVFGISSLASLAAAAALSPTHEAWTLLVFLIPTIWILLYMMKVGPESWHRPSAKQVRRQRIAEIEMANAALRAEQRAQEKARQAELRAERQQLTMELTNDALNFAKRTFGKTQK